MWTHTVLEVYTHVVVTDEGVAEEWPAEGAPADWIELGLVGYCQGNVEDVVMLTPLWKLLQWKLKGWLENACWSLGLD